MTKNVFDLIAGIVAVVEGLVGTLCTYFASIGKLDVKTAIAISDSAIVIGGAVLGVCARFVPDGEQKKLEKK